MRKLGAARTAAAASSARPSMADASKGEERGQESEQWGGAERLGAAQRPQNARRRQGTRQEVGALGSHGCHALATRRHFDEQVASAIQRVLEALFGLVRLGI